MRTKRKVLMVVANPAVSTTTGWPVGFWASELIHPYDAFVRQGYEVTIASPNGGKVELDAYSDPRDASGYSKDDTLSLAYLQRPEFVALLEKTPRVADLRVTEFDAIVVAGGQSPMFTFRDAVALQTLFMDFVQSGKISAALCHGTCLLLYLKHADGTPFVQGRTMTGFANSEEDYADKAVGQKLMPFRIEDEARKMGARFSTKSAFQPYAVRDGKLITGQQQHSGGEVARLVIAALEIVSASEGDTMGPSAPHIVIFGAGPGISRAVARRFGREGFKAVLVARSADRLRGEVEALAQEGVSACSYVADVADETSLSKALDQIGREQGESALVLYNAAAVHVIDILEEDWRTIRQQMEVNVGGAFVLAKRLIPEFLRRNGGTLFFTGGGFALQPSPQWTSLSLGKAALRNLVQALAARVAGHPVHVATVTVCGFVKNDDPHYNPDAIAEQFWRLYAQQPGQYDWEVQY